MKEALLATMSKSKFFDVFHERWRDDDDEPVRYIVDTSDLDLDAFAAALESALEKK